MITKHIIIKGKKVSVRTHNETNGTTRTYTLGKTKVFTNIAITDNGFRANVLARDGNVAVMDIIINKKGKMIGATIDHPKVHFDVINSKDEVTISAKKK